MRRLALFYSDGSNTVLQDGTTIDQALDDCAKMNAGERNPKEFTKVAWVEFELEAFVEPLQTEAAE